MKILLLRILCSILGAGIIKGLLYEYNIDLIPLYICMVCGSFTMTILIVDGAILNRNKMRFLFREGLIL